MDQTTGAFLSFELMSCFSKPTFALKWVESLNSLKLAYADKRMYALCNSVTRSKLLNAIHGLSVKLGGGYLIVVFYFILPSV